jgi:hypothetical protein
VSYFEERSPRGNKKIGYSYFGADTPVSKSTLTPQQRETLLGQIGGRTLQAAEGLLGVIDYPASLVRDMVAGNELGSGTTAGEALDSWGLRPSNESLGGWARPVADFAAGALLDPLNLIGFGVASRGGAALKAMRTAGGTNMLDDAARIASKRLIQNNDLGSDYAQNALKAWADNFGKGAKDLTDADLLARPLAGPRQSKRMLNVEDVIQAQDPAQIQKAIDDFNMQKIVKGSDYTELAKKPLTYDVGIGLPFSDHALAGFSIPGGAGLAIGMDRAGQIARWTAPGRYAHAAFNRDTFGATEEAGQIVGKEVADSLRQGEAIGRRRAADALQEMDNPFTQGVGESMRRILDGVPTQADNQLLQQRPDLQRFVDMWHGSGNQPGMAAEYLARRADAGMASNPLIDKFGGKYFPRQVDDMSFLDKISRDGPGASPSRSRAFSGATGDQQARLKSLHVPGGTDFINKLSLDANVAGPNRLKVTDDDAAAYIKGEIDKEITRRFPGGTLANGQPVPSYSIAQARKVARILRELDPKAIEAKLPMFGGHFTDDFQRYVVGNEKGIALNKTLYDLLGSTAKNMPAGKVPLTPALGQHIAVPAALKRLGLRTVMDATPNASPLMRQVGAKEQMMTRLAARFPGQVNDLKNVSLDKRMVDRLARIADFYDYPEVQGKWMSFFDGMTRLWKGSILSWPARFTRDWYSGGFSNLVEVGSPGDLLNGYAASRALMQGRFDDLDNILQNVPKYQGMTKAARKREFINDVAAGGLLSGRRAMDAVDAAKAIQTGESVADEFLPGMNPRTTIGMQALDILTGNKPLNWQHSSYSELFKNWDRVHHVGFQDPRNVGNPILRWGQKVGDITDSHNRISGFVGLLLQGIDPIEAASRIKAAHVDYSSLTALERETFRRFMPFWSYSSRMGKYVAGKIWERPGGRYTQLALRLPSNVLSSDDEAYVPESIRSNYGAAIPQSVAFPFGGAKEGVTPWLTSIGLPGVSEINTASLGYGPSGRFDLSQTLWNTGKNFASKMLHPAMKAPIEMISGENLFTKRPLKEFRPAISQIAEEVGIPENSVYGRAIKQASPLVDLIPWAPRILQTANRLMDKDKIPDFRDRLYQTFVNSTSGLQFQPVGDEARRIDASKNIREILDEDPLVRSMTQVYLPEDAEPYADQWTLDLLALDRQLGKEARAQRELLQGKPPKKARNTDPMSYWE